MDGFTKIINKSNKISIDWQLSNVCNFNCPYCPEESKNGSSGWPNLENCYNVVDTFSKKGLCEFSFSGGELTMWKDLSKLFSYIKQKGDHKIHLITNGYKSSNYWKKLDVDIITFSWHPTNNLNISKWCNNINLCNVKSKRVWVLSYPPIWDKVVHDYEYFKNNLKDIRILELKYVDERSEKISYNQEQLKFIGNNFIKKKEIGKFSLIINGNEEYFSIPNILSKNMNNFNGWKCNAGVKNFVLKTNGDVFPTSGCTVGRSLGNWFTNNFKSLKEPLICNVDKCWCGPDIKIEKWKV